MERRAYLSHALAVKNPCCSHRGTGADPNAQIVALPYVTLVSILPRYRSGSMNTSREFIGPSDGRKHKARRAVLKLLALGIPEEEVIKLIRWHRRRRKKEETAAGTDPIELDKDERRRQGQWYIWTLLALGFNEYEIADLAQVD